MILAIAAGASLTAAALTLLLPKHKPSPTFVSDPIDEAPADTVPAS